MTTQQTRAKVLIAGWGRPHLFGAILRLAEERCLKPCYWIDLPAYEGEIRAHFPDCCFHDVFAAIRGVPHPDLAHLAAHTCGNAFSGDWPAYETMALQMMDRLDPWATLHYRQRVDLFRHMVRYWTGILDCFRPDLCLFPVTPHFAHDYVLYGLAHSRGTQVLFFRQTAIPGYVYPVRRIEDPPPFVLSQEGNLSDRTHERTELPAPLEDHLRKLRGDYSVARPDYMRRQLAKSDWPKTTLSLAKRTRNVREYPRYVRFVVRFVVAFARNQSRARPLYYKQRFRSIQESHMGALEHRLYRLRGRLQRRRLSRAYHRLVVEPDLNAPFVYIPLHYQPERTTCPEGGAFSDQRRMVDVLSGVLPEGWSLYVKEHLSQFSPKLRGELGRHGSFYSDMTSYPNVRLVPANYDAFRLIDASKAVATVTGTAGWEAVVRGTPVLVFGYPWYMGCEGAFHVPSQELCNQALKAISTGYRVDYRKVRYWLRAMDEMCVKAYLNIERQSPPGFQEANAESLARGLLHAYDRLKQHRA